MNRNFLKSILRSIRSGLGRYLAILAIIALGCGFFSGLRICRSAMVETGDRYLAHRNFYDYRLLSTLGLTEEDVAAFANLEGVSLAEGSISTDALFTMPPKGNVVVMHAMSVPDSVNLPALTAGRLPQAANECLADSRHFIEEDLGEEILLATGNPTSVSDAFTQTSFRIVGLVSSPLYLNYERGSTSLGGGSVACFIYLPSEAFSSEYYTELYLTLENSTSYPIFSDGYRNAVETAEPGIRALLTERAELRRTELQDRLDQAEEALRSAAEQLRELRSSLTNWKGIQNLSPSELGAAMVNMLEKQCAEAEQKIAEGNAELQQMQESLKVQDGKLPEPTVYALTRDNNIGYTCFDNDSSIVQGIANVFPVFFFLLAALICSTTMTRMVSEERTQNGVLKALGYTPHTILSRYTVYAGSAAIIGSLLGFFVGTYFIPKLIWKVYEIMYGFAPMQYLFDPLLLTICLITSLLCCVGTAWLSCRAELSHVPAEMIRPKTPKSGKRILLERISPIWKRMKFLHKVSARNIFRYRKRFVMMILGIAGCTALLVTGFGIRDSVEGLADNQFDRIAHYDLSAVFATEKTEEEFQDFLQTLPDSVSGGCPAVQRSSEAVSATRRKNVNLLIATEENIRGFWDFHRGDESVAYPEAGQVILSRKFAEDMRVSVGDRLTFEGNEEGVLEVTVSGIFDNYVYDFAFLHPDTCREAWGTLPNTNVAFLNVSDSADIHEASAAVADHKDIVSVSVSLDLRERVSGIMSRLNYIILLVLVCAGALALIVLYNLTNINIIERTKEIATLKVLGFHRGETFSYVFRENAVLCIIGAILGLPLGTLLHRFVMSQINVNLVSFDNVIFASSYLISLAITFVFAVLVGFLMTFRIAKIEMAQSLKSVE